MSWRKWTLSNRCLWGCDGHPDTEFSRHFTEKGARRHAAFLRLFLSWRGGQFGIVLKNVKTGFEEVVSIQ